MEMAKRKQGAEFGGLMVEHQDSELRVPCFKALTPSCLY